MQQKFLPQSLKAIAGVATFFLVGCSTAQTTGIAENVGKLFVGGVDTVYVKLEVVNPNDSTLESNQKRAE
jgi:hypothetical protein